MRIKRVAVAMSGGVDSGVAVALVIKAGYKAAGFHMRLWQESPFHLRGEAKSSKREHLGGGEEAARKTAHQLGIPFYIVDLEKIFKKKVVDYFLREYGLGQTPNPCVMCNKFIKFGELLRYIRKLGCDYLATGHYARTRMGADNNADGRGYKLLMGRDKKKDQSYFLYNLTQKQLAQVMFPVGDYFKQEVKAMAKKWKLPVAERPESQEICFFPESDYRPFLKRQISEKIVPGEVVDTQRRVIGKHHGIPLYTIGQRHGFKIESGVRSPWPPAAAGRQELGVIPPYYVIVKDAKKNQLVVGFGKETEKKKFWVKEVNWIDASQELECKVRIRHQGELLESRVRSPWPPAAYPAAARAAGRQESRVLVELDEPERGVAPGQAAVFYKRVKEQENRRVKKEEYEVLGGGIIAIDPAKSRGAQALCGIAGSRT